MTILLTPRGQPVSTSSRPLTLALHVFEDQLLDYGSEAAALFEALPLDPDCALANAYAAALHLFRHTREGLDRARPLIDRARHLPVQTQRESSLVAAIARWVADDIGGATVILDDWTQREPGDLFAVKLLQHLLFATGQTGAMLASIGRVAGTIAGDPRVLGMHAFALDQTGAHDAAERTARAAIEIGPDPWANHALAHVMDAQGRYREGSAWMRDHADAWARCTSFLYTHNWWHAALFHLALDDHDGALGLYHERVWTMRKDYAQDQVNAVSLLARLELAGVDIGDRWHDVATYIAPRRFDAVDHFIDLHYAYALARAGDGDGVKDLLGAKAAACDGSIARQVGLTAAEGVAAYGFGDYATAARRLGAVAAELPLLGGSTVQRNLFTIMLASARAEGRRTLELAA